MTSRLIWLAWAGLGLCVAHGPLDEQIVEATRAIARDPRNAGLYLRRGELHRVHRDWDAARSDYDRAATLDPALAEVEFVRGRMLFEAGRPAEALPPLARFLALRPGNAEGLAWEASAKAESGDLRGAIAGLTASLAAHPDVERFLQREELQRSLGDFDGASQGLDDGIAKLGPIVTLELRAIELDRQRRRWDQALARIDRLAADSPRKETWLAMRGEVLRAAGREAEARQALAAALRSIEALPSRLRSTQAASQLETKLRSALR